MRVAKTRFFDSGQAADFAEALENFLNTYAFKSGPTAEWQEFRDNIWWSYENHSILQANQFGITKIFKRHWEPRKKWMTKNDCVELMAR